MRFFNSFNYLTLNSVPPIDTFFKISAKNSLNNHKLINNIDNGMFITFW